MCARLQQIAFNLICVVFFFFLWQIKFRFNKFLLTVSLIIVATKCFNHSPQKTTLNKSFQDYTNDSEVDTELLKGNKWNFKTCYKTFGFILFWVIFVNFKSIPEMTEIKFPFFFFSFQGIMGTLHIINKNNSWYSKE